MVFVLMYTVTHRFQAVIRPEAVTVAYTHARAGPNQY